MALHRIRAHARVSDAFSDIAGVRVLPREHVSVSSDSGRAWGCMGGCDVDARVVAEGTAEEEWVAAIAGSEGPSQGDAGIRLRVNGVCHQSANRILIPVKVTVDLGNGNEIAILLFGLYGPDVGEAVSRVIDAAEVVNQRRPGTVSEEDLREAVARVHRNLEDEYEILKNDFEDRIPVDVDALPESTQHAIRQLHRALHDERADAYESLETGKIDGGQYLNRLSCALRATLAQMRDLFGEQEYLRIFKYLPEHAARAVLGDSF